MDVSPGTVRRWAKEYGWERKEINARVIRYLANDVEKSLEFRSNEFGRKYRNGGQINDRK